MLLYRSYILVLLISYAPLVDAVAQTSSAPLEKAWTIPIEGSILSEPDLLEWADESLDHLYNMRYEQADSVFSLIESRYPEHPVGPFLHSLTIWWQILPTLSVKDTSLDQAFLTEMNRVIELSSQLESDPRYAFDAMFFKTAAYGFRGRLLSDRQEWLAAAQDGKSALDNVFEIADADTSNADLLFGVGVYDYFADAIPRKYPIVKPLMFFFPDGDSARGLKRLKLAAEHGRFVSAEAAYFLLQIYTVFEPNYRESMAYIGVLRDRYPDNALFHVLQGRIHYRWGQSKAARPVFERVIQFFGAGKAGYVKPLASQAHYYLGRDERRRDSMHVALSHFDIALELESGFSHDSYFRVNATLQKGMVLDVLGRRAEAEHAYNRVLGLKEYSNSRELARRYLKTPFGG